ncbi:MAG: trypsin-like peptidase domain-containing protein [Pyrinomonadaceae bacterium]
MLSVQVFAQDNLPELVRAVKPSAVAIETFGAKGEKLARGSGFFVAPDKIITNRHVIENASRVEIRLVNGKTYSSNGVLAIDGEGDLALLQISVPSDQAVPVPLSIEKSTPQEGESIVVIGNPYGLEGSVSNGIVSAVRDIAGYGRIIQITAPISPGSSGSPVVNMRGEVIGIATLQAAEGQSLNFAVPASRIAALKIGNIQSFSNLDADSRKNKRASAERLYLQGLGVLSKDDYARAVSFFEKATQIDPDYAEAWYQAGFAYGMLGKHAEALKATRQAARVRPDWAEAQINIGASSFALGQFKDAESAYRQAAKIDSSNGDTQYALGLTLNKLNRADEEILALKRAIALKPEYAAAFEKLGTAYFKAKRLNEALAAFEQFKILKGDAKAYNFVGETLFELGKFDESVEVFNTALGMSSDFAKARYNLGRAYLKLDNQTAAISQYEYLKNSNAEWADKLYVLIYP